MSYFFELSGSDGTVSINLDEIAALETHSSRTSTGIGSMVFDVVLKSGERITDLPEASKNYPKIMAKLKNMNGKS